MIKNIRNNSLIRAIKLVTKYQIIEFIIVNILQLSTTLLVANSTLEINKIITTKYQLETMNNSLLIIISSCLFAIISKLIAVYRLEIMILNIKYKINNLLFSNKNNFLSETRKTQLISIVRLGDTMYGTLVRSTISLINSVTGITIFGRIFLNQINLENLLLLLLLLLTLIIIVVINIILRLKIVKNTKNVFYSLSHRDKVLGILMSNSDEIIGNLALDKLIDEFKEIEKPYSKALMRTAFYSSIPTDISRNLGLIAVASLIFHTALTSDSFGQLITILISLGLITPYFQQLLATISKNATVHTFLNKIEKLKT